MTDWVRLWHDMPTDPKWRVVARKSGQPLPCVIAVFALMLTNASANASDRGVLLAWDHEDAGAALDMDADQIEAIYNAMQGKVLEGDRLTGWDRRQPKREDDSAKRVAKHRAERKRDVTHGNAPETETETEEDSEKEEEVTAGAAPAYAFCGQVIRLKPRDMDRWRRNFARIDVPGMLQSRDDWLATEADEPTKKKWYISTSNWLSQQNQKAANAPRPPTVPL